MPNHREHIERLRELREQLEYTNPALVVGDLEAVDAAIAALEASEGREICICPRCQTVSRVSMKDGEPDAE